MSDSAAAATSTTATAAAPAAAPAGTPAATTVSSVSGAQSTPTEWTTGFNEDTKAFVQNKGFKGAGDVVESYRNYEKLMGVPKDRLLKLPDKVDAPEWKDVWGKLGVPKEAKEYAITGEDTAFVDWAKNTFHQLNIPRQAGEALVNKYAEFSKGIQDAKTSQRQAQQVEQDVALKKEWGMAHDQNVALGKKAVQAFGLTADVIDKLEGAMGYSGVMKFMQALGSKLGEHGFVDGNTRISFQNGALSPDQAKSRITELKKDTDFTRRYVAGDMAAREEFEKLHRYAYPE